MTAVELEQTGWIEFDGMAWAVPLYPKRQVDRAGATFVDATASPTDRGLALATINNWRSSHAFPLNTFQVTLRQRARRVETDPLIAQRIKRRSSIESKLHRYSTMKLSQMQDIGGCRVILTSSVAVDALAERYRAAKRSKHILVRDDDYQRNPKPSGYRGIHLIYRYRSDEKPTYNGLQIEIQMRSRLQHAWATAVETVGTFVGQALKSSQGEDDWLKFFALMGSEIAVREGLPTVPGTPTDRDEIRRELHPCVAGLEVIERLEGYGKALQLMEDRVLPSHHYYLLELDTDSNRLTIRGYDQAELVQASEQYQALEQSLAGIAGRDVVLVKTESLIALRRAYPNYFADTTEFLKIVRDAIT